MADKPRIVFLVGGAYHPTFEQAELISEWLGESYTCDLCRGLEAFEALDGADLFVPMGTYFSGMEHPAVGGLPYRSPSPAHRQAFRAYVAGGHPLLVHHGSIMNYDDWPEFTELLGFRWDFELTRLAPPGEFWVHIPPTDHPIVAGVEDYLIVDELYMDVQVTPGLSVQSYAEVYVQDNTPVRKNGHRMIQAHPMIMAGKGGRIPGAGWTVYSAHGHDMRAFSCEALRQVWINTVRWLVK